jgi:glycosyltransferase involved in cell wall biosynthesis
VDAALRRERGGRLVKMLLVGEEHLRDKVLRHYGMLERRGIRTWFFVDDRSGITRRLPEAELARVTFGPDPSKGAGALLAYWAAFRRCFERVRPDVLEVYTSINPYAVLPMVAYARMRGARVAVVCRGELYPDDFAKQSPLQRRVFTRILRLAHLIVYKESYMPEVLARLCPRTPLYEYTNAVPVGPEPEYARTGNHLLFLNFFKPSRGLEVIVRASAKVRERVPDLQVHLVGGAGELARTSGFYAEMLQVEDGLRELIRERGVEDVVHVHPFTTDVRPHYDRAKGYLFPADNVWCNYALLEAMERGVPAVVSDHKDPHARRIVEHGVSGLVVPPDDERLAGAMLELLDCEERRQAMGRAARAKVVRDFDMDRGIDALAGRYLALAGSEP